MSRLTIKSASRVQTTMEGIYTDMERRINMLYEVQSNTATMETLEQIRNTARIIEDSADCALGVEAARMILRSLDGCWEDYVEHVQHHHCSSVVTQSIPCVASCPAGVDIPGYVALVEQERYADAVRLIRKDNPLPVACAMICEHPCESRCRRTLLDAPINIRLLSVRNPRASGWQSSAAAPPDCRRPITSSSWATSVRFLRKESTWAVCSGTESPAIVCPGSGSRRTLTASFPPALRFGGKPA